MLTSLIDLKPTKDKKKNIIKHSLSLDNYHKCSIAQF